jgi:hypothetical protein
MAMNLLNISKEIKKINTTLDYLKMQNNDMLTHLNTNYDINNISDEIKNNINDIYSKLEQLYNFNVHTKYNYENKNYNELSDYLTEINIEPIIINKIIFLNFTSLNDILLADDDILEKLDIPKETISYIKNKIQEKLYVSSIDI